MAPVRNDILRCDQESLNRFAAGCKDDQGQVDPISVCEGVQDTDREDVKLDLENYNEDDLFRI